MKTNEEIIEMKYEYIQAACAEAGDEVELFCISDNRQLKFTLPSSDEIEAFGLSLYREVTGNHVTGIIHYNDKEYKVTSIIKPDVNAQHTDLLRELSCLVNSVFHFGFIADYFSYYISDYYNEVFNDTKMDCFVQSILHDTAIKFKEQLLNKKNEEFTEEDHNFFIDYIQRFSDDQKLELDDLLDYYFGDLAYTLEMLIKNNTIILFTDTEKKYLNFAVIYAYTLSNTVRKTEKMFADNIWNLTNQLVYVRFTGNYLPDAPIQLIKETELRPYGFSMSLNSSVRIFSDIKEIPEGEFLGNTQLYSIALDEGSAETIGKMAFANSSLSNLSLPLSTKIIGEKAFSGCNIQTLIIPPTVEIIDANAFQNCKNLTEVLILNKNTIIDDSAFDGCSENLRITNFDATEQKEIEKQEGKIQIDDKNILDIVSPAYLIKKKADSCTFCESVLIKKDSIGDFNNRQLKIQMLYCEKCKIYYINSRIIDEYRISRLCSPRPAGTASNIVGSKNISNMIALPFIPDEILIKDKISTSYYISYQIVDRDAIISVEANPVYASQIKRVTINDKPITLPCEISTTEILKISVERKIMFPIKLDIVLASLNIFCNGIPVSNLEQIEDGNTISISENKSFTKNDPKSRSIVSVSVNSHEVSLPYQLVVKEKVYISAKYSLPIYFYADKRLKLTSTECSIEKCIFKSDKFDMYKIPKPVHIDVTSSDDYVNIVKSISCNNKICTLPAKIIIDHQATLSVDKVISYQKMIISDSRIIVQKSGIRINSGTKLQKGDILTIWLSGTSIKDFTVLQNGVQISVPKTISVGDKDIVLNLVPKSSKSIVDSVSNQSDSYFDKLLLIHSSLLTCYSRQHKLEQRTIRFKSVEDRQVAIVVEYCYDCQKYFISEQKYKSYLSSYKTLPIRLAYTSDGTYKYTESWDSKSQLNLCGYNVNANIGFSESYRQAVLKTVVDRKILNKSEVIKYLEFYINFHGRKPGMEHAVTKWKKDLNYVRNNL